MQTSSITFIIAFVVVLALIGLVAFLVRRFGGSRLGGGNANRGRMPRLAVIDAAAVDNRRRLVLVRRDNVEHLLMIGGPTDIVVEPNIVRASPARGDQMTPRASVGGDLPPRATQLPDAAGWTDGDSRTEAFEPIEEPAPRPARPTFTDEIRRPASPPPGDRREPSPNLGSSPMMPNPMIRPEPAIDTPRPSRGEPAIPRPSRMAEPPPRMPARTAAPTPPPAPAPTVPSNAEQNLTEMAQRLEAALRRPGDAAAAPPVAPDQPRGTASSSASRSEPNMAPPVTPSPKTGFENLEDEMASLLGRPKTPS